MPNQNSAPLPQDVHPQAYQPAAVNGPPGPQWGAAPPHAQQGPPTNPFDYDRNRMAAMQAGQPSQPVPGGQLPPYDHRDGGRQGVPPPPRPGSPRQEPMRYQEPPRSQPTPRRGSPSPRTHSAAPNMYQGPQPPPQGQPSQQPSHQQPPHRITNPNYGPHVPSAPPAAINGPPGQGPYGRMPSPGPESRPIPEVRPLVENRPPSAGSQYPPQTYQHHANPAGPPGIAGGAPAPAAALAAAEAAQREREERTPSAAPKRSYREWEDGNGADQKPPSGDEKRPRLDDGYGRRPSPSPRPRSPMRRYSPAPELRHLDERRMNDGYHPSEAAHHPPSLPAMHQGTPQPPQPFPNINDAIKDERKDFGPPPPPSTSVPPQSTPQPPPPPQQHHEAAARKMEVDEDYDDEGEDEKRPAPRVSSERNSPRSGAQPVGPEPVKV